MLSLPMGMGPPCTGIPRSQEWRPIQTCSPEDKPPTSTDIC